MPFKIEEAAKATKPVKVLFGAQELNIEHLWAGYTPSTAAQIAMLERSAARIVADAELRLGSVEDALAQLRRNITPDAEHENQEEHLRLEELRAAAVAELQAALEQQACILGEQLAPLVASWDAVYADGSPIPIEPSIIAKVFPLVLLRVIFEGIQKANQVNPTKKPS